MIRSALARIGLIAVVLAVTGCTMGTDEAKQGVAEFGARVSRQSFGEIYRAASPEFRQAATEEEFAGYQVSSPLLMAE